MCCGRLLTVQSLTVARYDSILEDGSLKWQNELNHSNQIFFDWYATVLRNSVDSCDGIFLNYQWNREKLQNSSRLAGERKFDVYTGIDIFGRNTFGGGGYDTNKVSTPKIFR